MTLLRSRVSPSFGRPRAAACSKAKLGAAAKVPAPSETAASSLIHRYGRCTKARGLMMVMYLPPRAGRMTVSRPMSWNSGSHVTPRESSLSSMESTIWSAFVPTARWVISTPAGTRVEPEVYCRYAMSSSSMSGRTHVSPTVSGIASTAMMRGRSAAGSERNNCRTPAADDAAVRIAVGLQSPRTA